MSKGGKNNEKTVTSMTLSSSGRYLALGNCEGQIIVSDIYKGLKSAHVIQKTLGTPEDICFIEKDTLMAVGTNKNLVEIYAANKDRKL